MIEDNAVRILSRKKMTKRVSPKPIQAKKPIKTHSKTPDTPAKEKRQCGFDVQENCTLFIRNLPYGATAESVQSAVLAADATLGIDRVFLVKDATGQPKGTAFIKLKSAADAQRLLGISVPKTTRADELASFLGPRIVDAPSAVLLEGLSSGITMSGRLLYFLPAQKPSEVTALKQQRQSSEEASKARSRNLHLLREGEVSKDSEAYQKLSASERRQREDGRKEREYKMTNPNFFVSDHRVSFRNLPVTVQEKDLKQAVRQALGVTGQAAGAIVKATVIVDKESNKSKGFGFVEFRTHEQALQAVRSMNNQPLFFGPTNTRSPIVEFTLEDKRKLKILEAARQRHRQGARNA